MQGLVEPVNPAASAGAGANRATVDKDKIVVSAITARSMGALTIVQDCLEYLSRELAKKYEVIAILQRRGLVDYPNVRYVEIPNARTSYFHRRAGLRNARAKGKRLGRLGIPMKSISIPL